jgi:3-oxoacyl-[acyl-carrier protein] reductase
VDFRDKIVIVTGSSRGIGAAIARAFAGEGASVVVNYVQNADAADDVVAACRSAGGDALPIQADVTSAADIQALIERTLDEFGRIDVLVNNAFKPYTFDPEARKMFWAPCFPPIRFARPFSPP